MVKQSKVLLINYAGYLLNSNTFIPDNSLGTLAAVLKSADIPSEIIDFQNPLDMGNVMENVSTTPSIQIAEFLKKGERPGDELVDAYHYNRNIGEELLLEKSWHNIYAKIEKEQVKLIGFKLWIGNGLIRAISLAKKIKHHFPDITLVGGGPAISYLDQLFFEYTDVFDYLVYGEGEKAILLLALGHSDLSGCNVIKRAEKSNNDIPVRRTQIKDLSEVPFPTYQKEIYPNIDLFYKMRIIDESRGCFNHCAFCSHAFLGGRGVRKRNSEYLVDELERMVHEDGVNYFRFSGSNPPWPYIVDIGKEIIRRNLKINYSIFSSINNAKAIDMPLLRASGLRSIFFGIESADEHYLKEIHHKRNASKNDLVELLQMAMSSQIYIALSFIVPSPFETEITKRQTLDLIKAIFERHHYGSVMILPAFLSPGSLWWQDMERFGFSFDEGLDKKSYLLNMLERHYDYLLPKDSWKNIGYRLNNRPLLDVFSECASFSREVGKLGIITDFDDSAFLLAEMGGVATGDYKSLMMNNLLLGGAERLVKMVGQFNERKNLNGSFKC